MVGDRFDSEGFEFKQIPETQLKKWSMVSIRDSVNDCSLFPPRNHENLHIPSSPSLSSSASSSLLSSFSPSDSDDSGPLSPARPNTQVGQSRSWVGFWAGLMRSKLLGIGSYFGWERVWAFGSGAGIAAAVFVVWSFYFRARRRRRGSHFKDVVREKDEKISKLLHQIAQLNEVLVARHRALASKLAE